MNLDCVPTSGPKAGEKCIFPFTLRGKTCQGPLCCDLSGVSKTWCSTKLYDNGIHRGGYWGWCENTPCQSPGMS